MRIYSLAALSLTNQDAYRSCGGHYKEHEFQKRLKHGPLNDGCGSTLFLTSRHLIQGKQNINTSVQQEAADRMGFHHDLTDANGNVSVPLALQYNLVSLGLTLTNPNWQRM
jgi:hypothetical protein